MSTALSTAQSTRPLLQGRLLLAIRIAWIALAVLTLAVFIASIPVYFRQQTSPTAESEQPVQADVRPPIHFRVGYAIALDCLAMLVFFFIAAAILWRGTKDRIAILVSAALLTMGAAISPTLDALGTEQPTWQLPVRIVQDAGFGLILFVFYLFPDGRFAPRWTRILAIVGAVWAAAWFLIPTLSLSSETLSLPLRILVHFWGLPPGALEEAQQVLRRLSFFLVILGWLVSGVLAQIYRFARVSSPVQRQQTKWVVYGLTAAVAGYAGYQLLPQVLPILSSSGMTSTLQMIGKLVSTLLLILAPISIMASLLRFRLWDIDPIIHRTLVYGALTTTLAALYVGSVFILQRIFHALTGQQSDMAIIISTLAIAALVQPLRRRVQELIDRGFYRDRVDFRRAFTSFSREIRTIIEMPDLLRTLIQRTIALLHISHGAVFLYDPKGVFERAEAINLPAEEQVKHLPLATTQLGRLQDGLSIPQPENPAFPLLVPLIAPRTEGSELVGVLALGARLSGQGYSREDRALLTSLADQAGTAIYVARLITEREAEARRREEVERRLEAHRDSPIGRAEFFAHNLLRAPHTALTELHRLTQTAGQDPHAANLIENLPRVLDSLGATPIAKLAEGFNYLIASESEPEMLPVGLRTLIAQLESLPRQGLDILCPYNSARAPGEDAQQEDAQPTTLQHGGETLAVYKLCQAALEASTIPHISQLLQPVKELEMGWSFELFRGLERILGELRSVAEALHAYERVDTSRDKLAYLASGVERLRRVDYLARTELGSADRTVVHHIVENWLSVVTGAMSDLQTRAQVVCNLLTRHTWHSDIVPLILSLRNDGRGAALNLTVTLAPAPEYTLLDEAARIERLAPGEEIRVELRVRPHLVEGADQFRARFIIVYTDPRGPDQVENFADVVRLLAAEGEFQFIPNPYVVGTPLEAGSPLFFGREDVVSFIQENLSALHRNNLVLIGQRRTGKTSLLKQLPVRLGDDYLPVYLDGQALGLDPGLPNFFLAMATEIGFAMEDRGLEIEIPEYEDLADSPATFFEREFLARVRAGVGDRHVIAMFDEFEALEAAVQRGNLDSSIFGFLRHLIQHSANLSVIFCGTHRLEELAADYWSVLFNISLYRHIAFLEKEDACRLIQDPVAAHGMKYDDLALDKMWQVTSGHPYFLQLLCHSLVNRHNKTERNYVTVADVNGALDEILASGEAHFVFLWAEAAPEERLILAALSRMIPLTGQASLVQIRDYLAERGISLERQKASDALHHLALRDILAVDNEMDPAGGEIYRWRLGLLGLWAEKFKSLNRVMEEMQQ